MEGKNLLEGHLEGILGHLEGALQLEGSLETMAGVRQPQRALMFSIFELFQIILYNVSYFH